MKKNWLVIAVLTVAVAALGGFVYFQPRGGVPEGHALSTLRTGEVRHIRIERGEALAIVLEKKQDRWLISAPLAAPADDFHVQRLLAILDARTPNRLAATDLARFDLAPPKATLTIDGQAFGFGAINPVTREQYVLAADAVYPVVLNYGAALPADVSQLIAKQLFDQHEAPARFAFGAFAVELQDGKWRMSPPVGEPGQDDFNRWVDAWRHASALRAEPHDRRKPQEEITIELSDRKSLVLGILQREPEFVVARPDRNLQYVFALETGRRLLSPPGLKPVVSGKR